MTGELSFALLLVLHIYKVYITLSHAYDSGKDNNVTSLLYILCVIRHNIEDKSAIMVQFQGFQGTIQQLLLSLVLKEYMKKIHKHLTCHCPQPEQVLVETP